MKKKFNKQLQEHVIKMRRMEAMAKTLVSAQYARRDKAIAEKSKEENTDTDGK